VGDLGVLAQYRFFNDRASRTEAALLFGVELPTGDTSVNSAAGERFEAEFQPGSGSVDYLLGLAVTRRLGAWSFDANVLYQFTGEGGPKATQHHHHEEAPPSRGAALDLVLELNGEWHDRQSGEHGFHSGGNTIYLSPGVRLSVDRWSGFLSVGVPVVTNLNGIQPEPEWRILSGVTASF
jgi:hypothetical protein